MFQFIILQTLASCPLSLSYEKRLVPVDFQDGCQRVAALPARFTERLTIMRLVDEWGANICAGTSQAQEGHLAVTANEIHTFHTYLLVHTPRGHGNQCKTSFHIVSVDPAGVSSCRYLLISSKKRFETLDIMTKESCSMRSCKTPSLSTALEAQHGRFVEESPLNSRVFE